MKNFCTVLIVVLIIALVGCKKDPVYFTLNSSATVGGTISPSYIEVEAGSDVSFTLIPDVGFINATTISVNGKLEPLSSNTYTLSNIANNYELKADFEKTMQWYLLQNNWEKTVWQRRLVTAKEDDWEKTVVAPQLAFEKLVYHENNRFEMFNEKGVLYGDGNYVVKADSVISGGIRRKIIKADNETLILEGLSKFYSAPYVRDPSQDVYVRETYVARKK